MVLLAVGIRTQSGAKRRAEDMEAHHKRGEQNCQRRNPPKGHQAGQHQADCRDKHKQMTQPEAKKRLVKRAFGMNRAAWLRCIGGNVTAHGDW